MPVITPQKIIDSFTCLSSFPDIAIKINDAVQDQTSSIDDITAVVKTDPALSSSLLKLANSPVYARGAETSDISRAVSLIGLRDVRDLAYCMSAKSAFDGIPFDILSVEDFWRHSLCCAIAAENIAKIINYQPNVSLFTAGLLHDIGQPILYAYDLELTKKALAYSLDHDDGTSPHIGEREIFGLDHTDVGAAIAKQWNFPNNLVDCIDNHHMPYKDKNAICMEVLIINLANSLGTLAELGSYDLYDAPTIDKRIYNNLNFSKDIIKGVIDFTGGTVEPMLEIFTA